MVGRGAVCEIGGVGPISDSQLACEGGQQQLNKQEDSAAWLGGALSMRLEGWGQSQTLSWLAKAAISQLMMNKCCFDGAAFGVQLVRHVRMG